MQQLILHLIGDYVTQSDWMANNKTKNTLAATLHALVYSLPFLFILQPSLAAILVIFGTHLLIDRFRLARFVVWVKNITLKPINSGARYEMGIRSSDYRWANCSTTGYPSDTPPWLAVWLLIAADNTIHLAINYAALRWL